MSGAAVIIGLLVALVIYLVGRRRQVNRHSWFYRRYMKSNLWKFRRWLWYWTSARRCEKCGHRLSLHSHGISHRLGAATMTVHHKHYRNLGHERRGRDVQLLCWPCHEKADRWRHR